MFPTFDMATDIFNYDERLFGFIASGKYNDVHKCLIEGANPTKISNFCGRTAVGQAALLGEAEILDLLLRSCEQQRRPNREDIAPLSRNHQICKNTDVSTTTSSFVDTTPDDMNQLEWDDEFEGSDSNSCEGFIVDSEDMDECSSLYKYYAKTFEVLCTVSVEPVDDVINDPNCLDALGMTPMHYVAACGNLKCLEILLSHNATVDVTTDEGLTPLHMGVANETIVRQLLSHKADPNRKTFTTRETPLHFALQRRNLAAVKLLLQAGANINSLNNNEQTPLMTAIINNMDEIAICLINYGAKLNLEDLDGNTALHLAVTLNNVNVASHLLAKGARLMMSQYPLHYCVKENMVEMAQVLIDHRANLNVRDLFGCTAIMLSIMYGRARILECLLMGASQSTPLDRIDDELYLGVQYAETVEDFTRIARVLMVHGGVLLNRDSNLCCQSPLSRAIIIQKFDIAQFLVKEGADVATICKDHVIATLRLAVDKSFVDLTVLLIHAGLKISPLQTAAPPHTVFGCHQKPMEASINRYCRNPLSLQSLARIKIRRQLILNLNAPKFIEPIRAMRDYTASIISRMTQQLDIPKLMQTYISEFDELPKSTDPSVEP